MPRIAHASVPAANHGIPLQISKYAPDRFHSAVTSRSAVPVATSLWHEFAKRATCVNASGAVTSAMRNFRLDNCTPRSQTSGRYEDAIWKIPVCCIRRNRDRCGRQLLHIFHSSQSIALYSVEIGNQQKASEHTLSGRTKVRLRQTRWHRFVAIMGTYCLCVVMTRRYTPSVTKLCITIVRITMPFEKYQDC